MRRHNLEPRLPDSHWGKKHKLFITAYALGLYLKKKKKKALLVQADI